MCKSNITRKVLTGILAVFLCVGGSCKKSDETKPEQPTEAAQAAQKPPVENLFAVRVNKFDFTLSQIDQFLMGVSPVPLGLQMLVRMQLAGALGDPELAGVNMGGTFAAFGVLLPAQGSGTDAASRVLIAGLIPVSDYEKFTANPKFSAPDAQGIRTIKLSIPGPGAPGAGGPAAAAAEGSAMVVTELGEYALVTAAQQREKLLRYKELMAGKEGTAELSYLTGVSDTDAARQGNAEPIWLYGNIRAAADAFDPMITAGIQQIKTAVQGSAGSLQQAIDSLEQTKNSLGPNEQGQIEQLDAQIKMLKDQQKSMAALQSPQMLGKIMDMYIAVLERLIQQGKSLALVVRPSPDVLHIGETFSAVPGTELAKMFSAGEGANDQNKLLGYLEDGVAGNFAIKLGTPFWKELTTKSVDLVGALAGPNAPAERIAEMKALSADALDALGGSAAVAFSFDAEAKPPFRLKYVVEVRDTEKFNSVLDRSAGIFKDSGIGDFYKALGIDMDFSVQRGTGSYKGVSIDSAKLVMKSTDPNSPPAQAIEAIYGDGFDYRWALVDGLCAIAVGGDVDSAVKELIDTIKAGGPKEIAGEVKDALEMLPGADKADFLVTYNYVRVLKMVGPMTARMGLPGPGMEFPKIDVPTKSNINIAGKVADGRLAVDIALPKQHARELVSAVMVIQQHAQAQQNVTRTKTMIETLDSALERFKLDVGRYPSEAEGLAALARKPAGVENWQGPYIKTPYVPKDAWNNDYIYEVNVSDGSAVLRSYGADGREGGEGVNADLSSELK